VKPWRLARISPAVCRRSQRRGHLGADNHTSLPNGIVLTNLWLGWVDLLGRKRYFVICIAMFTGSARFLLGGNREQSYPIESSISVGPGFLFGGGLQPNQQSIILDTFSRRPKRSAAFGVLRAHRHRW